MPRLLIVDDEPDNVELLSRRLTRRGFEVDGALSAADGFARIRDRRPDLILMDIKMPQVDGYEAITRLKADPDTLAIPVIALTAHAMPEDRERTRAVGADEYESKPVDLPRLLDKIDRLIGRTPAG